MKISNFLIKVLASFIVFIAIPNTLVFCQPTNNSCLPPWTLITYTNSTTAYGEVTIDDVNAEVGDYVGAFVNGEPRAFQEVVINNGKAYVTLVIGGNTAETVNFKIWDVSSCSEVEVACEATTDPGEEIGTPPNFLDICGQSPQIPSLRDTLNLVIENTDGAVGTTIRLPIRGSHINKLESIKLSLQSDNSIVKVTGTTEGALTNLTTFQPNDQTINIGWFAPGGVGLSLEDNTILFYLNIEFTGDNGACTNIQFKQGADDLSAFQDFGSGSELVTPKVISGISCLHSNVSIIGRIHQENDVAVPEVEVNCPICMVSKISDINGDYLYESLPSSLSYILKPSKIGDAKIGLHPQDAFLIQQYILNRTALNSPYLLIAADVNRDGAINVIDQTLIVQIAIGARTDFSDTTPWVFVPKSYMFNNPEMAHKENYPDSIKLENLIINAENQDFIAIKMGDLDWSNSNLLNSEPRFNQSLNLNFTELPSNNKNIVEVLLTLEDNIKISSLLSTFGYDSQMMELIDVEPYLPNLVVNSTDKNFTIAWFDEEGIGKSLRKGQSLLKLKVKKQNSDFSNKIVFEQSATSNTAFNANGEKLSLQINTIANKANKQVTIQPNPFAAFTTINLNLVMSKTLNLLITDLSGKIILEKKQTYPKGKSSIQIDGQDLSNSGLYFFKIQGSDFNYNGKLVLLKD